MKKCQNYRVGMIRKYIILFVLFTSISCNNDEPKKVYDIPAISDSRSVPKDLYDCFEELNKILPDSTKQIIINQTEEEFSADAHFRIGQWIRNSWIRNKRDTTLRQYFNNLEIFHPDDMSGIILDSYSRFLKNKEINLNQQINYYKEYWQVAILPDTSTFPKGAKEWMFKQSYIYKPKNKNHGQIHIGTMPNSNMVWIYDFHYGWTKATKKDVNNLENNVKDRETVLKEIFRRSINLK